MDMPLCYQHPSTSIYPCCFLLPFHYGQFWDPAWLFCFASKHCYQSSLTVLCFLILLSVLPLWHWQSPLSSEPCCGVTSSVFRVSRRSFLLPPPAFVQVPNWGAFTAKSLPWVLHLLTKQMLGVYYREATVQHFLLNNWNEVLHFCFSTYPCMSGFSRAPASDVDCQQTTELCPNMTHGLSYLKVFDLILWSSCDLRTENEAALN